MPNRWLHESIDLIVLGKSFWQLHRAKDSASRTHGVKHRSVGHPWYSRFPREWTFENPFPESLLARTRHIRTSQSPEAAETYQASVIHDHFDRLWDSLDFNERRQLAQAIRHLVLSPDTLLEWAGVDVIRGLIKRTYGPENGLLFHVDTWEREPTLLPDYQNLCAYIKNKPIDDLV
jgi:hypothetical protein